MKYLSDICRRISATMQNKIILLADLLANQSFTNNPYNNESRNDSYAVFVEKAAEMGMELYITHFNNVSADGSFFYWTLYNGHWTLGTANLDKISLAYAEVPPHEPQSMHLREMLIARGITVLNDTRLLDIATDKVLSYELFPELIPYTVAVNNDTLADEVTRLRNMTVTDTDLSNHVLFLKPRYGLMGDGIHILEKDTPLPEIDGDHILQLFMESGNGIEELGIEGRHDMRLFIHNGRVVQFKVRMPRNHAYVCNRNYKGDTAYYDINDLPAHIRIFAEEVDKSFAYMYPRLYSIDIGFSKNGNMRIYEFNTMPGLGWKKDDEEGMHHTMLMQDIVLKMLADVVTADAQATV